MILLVLYVVFFTALFLLSVSFGRDLGGLSVYAVLPFWILVNVLDLDSTIRGLSVGMEETNPFLRSFMGWFGKIKGLVIGKIILTSLFTCLVLALNTDVVIMFSVLTIAVTTIVIRNYYLYLRKKNMLNWIDL